jgi:hypothetical protein
MKLKFRLSPQAQKYLQDTESRKRDVELSYALLSGIEQRDNSGLPYLEFLSHSAENDAREALCRLLGSNMVPRGVMFALQEVFSPRGFSALKAILKKRTQGHPTHASRDLEIAFRVHELREQGRSYDDATAEVADAIGKSQEHVKKIYGRTTAGVDADCFNPIPRRRRKSNR